MTEKNWAKIKDTQIEMIWVCERCNFSVRLPPTFYEDSGAPVCDCDRDMAYSHTEILPDEIVLTFHTGPKPGEKTSRPDQSSGTLPSALT